ncbi:lsm domain-containing protein [Diaporthe amygdali]|uniref:lsm domain-containing protein n=1 Tax=Phomopsis amygdali TaxID=1214568 RepID=UPI0022FE058A|nr:lsm domain-containing protein [Diaporthe amygdali]KAJ0121521.1 lsm domain-containing protein [Diaporthe amygdali]
MSLNQYIDKKVSIMTADGRTLVGTLISADNQTNLVLQNAIERVIRPVEDPEPSVEVPLGLYIVRGDNVCLVGVVDEDIDNSIDWTAVKGAPIGGIKHS